MMLQFLSALFRIKDKADINLRIIENSTLTIKTITHNEAKKWVKVIKQWEIAIKVIKALVDNSKATLNKLAKECLQWEGSRCGVQIVVLKRSFLLRIWI